MKGAGEAVRIPSRLLLGIVPEVLLRSFHFWQYQVSAASFSFRLRSYLVRTLIVLIYVLVGPVGLDSTPPPLQNYTVRLCFVQTSW